MVSHDRDLPPEGASDALLARLIRLAVGDPTYIPSRREVQALRHALDRTRQARAVARRARLMPRDPRPRKRMGDTPTPSEIVGEILVSLEMQALLLSVWAAVDVAVTTAAASLAAAPAARVRRPR